MQPMLVLVVALAYVIGAIPTGLIVARVYRNVDITRVGSQRTGATNVLRTLGPGAAAIVFLGDAIKGVAAVLLANAMTGGDALAASLAAIAAVVGHSYSVFIGFRGGRGVTTGLGSLVILAPAAAIAAVALGAVFILLTRYVSLGSIVGAATGGLLVAALAIAGMAPAPYSLYGLAAAAFIIFSHRDNIARLINGTERRLGERAEPS